MSQEIKPTNVFRENLRELPAFLALLRSVEQALIADLEFEKPVLDLGCGDGYFGSIAFEVPPDVGMDLQTKSILGVTASPSYSACCNRLSSNLAQI